MAADWYTSIDLHQNELLNPRAQNLASAPAAPAKGQFYFDTGTNTLRWYDGNSWVTAAGGTPTGTAGGDLSGNYPNPTIGAGKVTDTHIAGDAAIALSKLATDPLARANHTGAQAAATISDLAATVKAYRLDEFAKPTESVDLNNRSIVNLATPVGPQDAATKAYVDTAAQGLDFKSSVRVATTANVTLTGPQTVDGIALVAGQRVLVKDQTNAAENGIYEVAAAAWARATDAATNGQIKKGSILYVEGGTTNGSQLWVCTATAADPWVPGTSTSTWTMYFAVTDMQAGDGLYTNGNVIHVGAGAGIIVEADAVGVDTAVVARKFTATYGNGALATFAVPHGLANQWPTITVFDTVAKKVVYPELTMTDANSFSMTFSGLVPANNQIRVSVVG